MYSEIDSNKRKSTLLIIVFMVFLGILAWVVSQFFGYGIGGFGIVGILIIIVSLIGYFKSGSIVLSISGAREATKKEFPHLVNTVEGLAIAAGLPTPKCYVIDSPALNAFATGRDPQHAAIAVTTGLLAQLKRIELEGVIGHEMAHIQNYDIRLMTLVGVFVGVSVLISDIMLHSFFWGEGRRDMGRAGLAMIGIGLVLAILTPFIAQAIKLAISRKREFLADASGSLLTRYPEGLASALEKIGKDTNQLHSANKATAHLFISNPLKNSKVWFAGMFATHPPIEERIKKLRGM